jgi:hypothetical protein
VMGALRGTERPHSRNCSRTLVRELALWCCHFPSR